MVQFQKQPMMRRVLLCLIPIFLHSVWRYGIRSLIVLAVSFAAGIATEWLFERKKGGKVSEAVLVTCALFAFAMPPAIPLWIVVVGIVFAVFMAKEVYGGFGRNIFNPAISGRLFVYLSFAPVMTRSLVPGGWFGSIGGSPLSGILIGAPDVISGASALSLLKTGKNVDILSLLLGFHDGAIGEGCFILIVISGMYLMATKTANWRIILGGAVAALISAGAFFYGGVRGALPPESLMAGSFAFVLVFMATDPVSAPKKALSLYFYGAMIGLTVVVIRTFSAFPEGTSFAILLGNTFAPMIDRQTNKYLAAKKARASAQAQAGSGREGAQ